MDINDLARQIRAFGIVLAYDERGAATLAFKYPTVPAWLKKAIRDRRRGLARRMHAGDITLCPSPGAHRCSWRYCGGGLYQCELCAQLDRHQLGLWSAA